MIKFTIKSIFSTFSKRKIYLDNIFFFPQRVIAGIVISMIGISFASLNSLIMVYTVSDYIANLGSVIEDNYTTLFCSASNNLKEYAGMIILSEQ